MRQDNQFNILFGWLAHVRHLPSGAATAFRGETFDALLPFQNKKTIDLVIIC
jgi:hypothetical protein